MTFEQDADKIRYALKATLNDHEWALETWAALERILLDARRWQVIQRARRNMASAFQTQADSLIAAEKLSTFIAAQDFQDKKKR